MNWITQKFLTVLILTSTICACKPTEGIQALDKQQLSTNNCQYKEPAMKGSVASPFVMDIGQIKVEEALKKCPELQKAAFSFIVYADKKIQMPNSYVLTLVDSGIVFFQFDEETNVLQNILVSGSKQDFESAKEDLKKQYLPYKQYTLAEFEATSIVGTTFENHQQFIEENKDKLALFKHGSVLITLSKDITHNDSIFIMYQNSDYLSVLKQKAELPSVVIQLLAKQEITEDIGHITVEKALKKYPELQKTAISYITYADKFIQMPNNYILTMENGGMVFFQFDEETNVLQNVLVNGLNQDFESAKEDLKKQYPPYPQYTLAEFDASSIIGTTFENHQKFLEEHKNELALFKQGSVLITLSKDFAPNGSIYIAYQNSDYLPVLKGKAELSSRIIQSLAKQQITEDIGHIKVEEALKKYPKLQKVISSTISYAGIIIEMPNSYSYSLDDGTSVLFQFDEKTNVLQSIFLMRLKQSFKSTKKDLIKLYQIYPQLTAAEFEAFALDDKITFKNHRQFLEEHKDQLAFFKQGSVLISLGKDSQNVGSTIVVYLNSDYLPALKEKHELIK